MQQWQKLLMAAGGAAAAAGVLYYLLREEAEVDPSALDAGEEAKVKGAKRGEVSREEMIEILTEMVETQKKLKASMKALAKDMASKPIAFEDVYAKVKDAQPTQDPLERRGLSMADFETPLQKHQNDPAIMQLMGQLMGGDPTNGGANPAKVKSITVDKIIEINAFMLQELQSFITSFTARDDKVNFDMKTVVTASQAMLDAKVTSKFQVASEEIEAAIMANQGELIKHQKFIETHMKMQQTMEAFMSGSF
eukprot:TRINITY_DN71563_c0_g1_i1.p1 TRINITY_DN71563_c0_g1~~TRINITY_DN71563_c0_g1_i1.p1  ORF type:complete len:251 (-),score=93.91 TRINITY_DN71563_c0_g1_i1:160-912(-)